MKKFILILLMTLTLTSLFAINIFAINVDYTFNITDNKKWNLETGSIQDDLKFAVTSKMIIKDDRIITSSETYHHVVFWNSKNQFIGYKNSQYSILENDYYLGNIEYGSAGFDAPATAHFFSFMIYKSGNAINYTELGNQSLSDIFDLYNSSNLEDKDNNTLDGYSLDELYNTQLSGKNLLNQNGQTVILNTLTCTIINITGGTTYTYKGYAGSSSYTSGLSMYEYVSGNWIATSGIPYASGTAYTFTTSSNATAIAINGLNNPTLRTAQIEKGSTATPYEPHASVLTRDYFKDYEQITNTNYTELDNGRLRYVVNQDTISSNSQPLYELNGLSLDDVFVNGNNITGFTTNGTGTIVNLGNDEYSYTITNSQSYNGIGLLGLPNYNNDKIYNRFEIKNAINVNNPSYYHQNATSGLYYWSNNFIANQWVVNSSIINNVGDNTTVLFYNGGNALTNGMVSYFKHPFSINLTSLSIDNLTKAQMDAYFDIYAYFRDGGTDPQTFTYDSPIYYDITYRLDEQFNGLDITAQEFIDNQDGYNRIINNEQANDFILYYAAQYAQDNNTSLGLSIQQWEQYYLNYLTFDDANSPFIASLNYNSLNNVFLDSNLINVNNFSTNDGTITVDDDSIIFSTNSNFYPRFNHSSFTINNTYDYYWSVNTDTYGGFNAFAYVFKSPNSEGSDKSNPYVSYTYSELNSSILTANDTVNAFPTYVFFGDNITVDIELSNFLIIDLTTLGIDNLTSTQMDAYFVDYKDNQTLEQNLYLQSLTPTSFDLIDPNYDYTAPPPDDFLDVDSDTFLDNLLTNIGFNNDLGKVTLSILILFLTTLTLIKFNLGTSVILGVDILVYVGLTFLGWLPAWINILIALIIMVLFYLRFKGGGSNNEESD